MKLRRARRQLFELLKGPEEAARAAGVTIGRECRILSRIATSEPWLVTIGNRVTITGGVVFATHDGSGFHVRDDRGRRYRYAPITIGDDVFIGQNTVILPGVRVGDGAIVGAGSVLTRSVPAGTVVAGNPARVISTRAAFDARVLQWPAREDQKGDSLRARIDSIAETQHRPEMLASSLQAE
jgi:acetyltransferase-like isoleucine patch superfamily enzyme